MERGHDSSYHNHNHNRNPWHPRPATGGNGAYPTETPSAYYENEHAIRERATGPVLGVSPQGYDSTNAPHLYNNQPTPTQAQPGNSPYPYNLDQPHVQWANPPRSHLQRENNDTTPTRPQKYTQSWNAAMRFEPQSQDDDAALVLPHQYMLSPDLRSPYIAPTSQASHHSPRSIYNTYECSVQDPPPKRASSQPHRVPVAIQPTSHGRRYSFVGVGVVSRRKPSAPTVMDERILRSTHTGTASTLPEAAQYDIQLQEDPGHYAKSDDEGDMDNFALEGSIHSDSEVSDCYFPPPLRGYGSFAPPQRPSFD